MGFVGNTATAEADLRMGSHFSNFLKVIADDGGLIEQLGLFIMNGITTFQVLGKVGFRRF